LTIAPRAVIACPVCFGQNDSPLANAMNNGILLMLGVVVAVLMGFASFFIYLMRRAQMVERAEGTARATAQTIRGREGTAQC
jgi:hypothetical protein